MPLGRIEVSTAAELQNIWDWDDLWQHSRATPFQSPHWLLPWWKHFGQGDLRLVAFRRDRRLVALAPLCVFHNRGTRELRLMGAGNTDYLDLLAARRDAAEAAANLLEWAASPAAGVDALLFEQLPPGSALLKAGRAELGVPCPVLPLQPGVDLHQQVPGAMADNLQHYRRRVEKIGPVQFEAATPENFEELFAALVRLHGQRRARRGLPGVLDEPRSQHFHHAVAHGFLLAGVLRMYGMRVGGELAAVYYGFHCHGRAYHYLSGFEPRFEMASAGTLVVAHAIEQALREGAREFDFLRGRDANKYSWGAQDRPTYRIYRSMARRYAQPAA